jgi:hypothetical protein
MRPKFRTCIALAAALYLDSHAALPHAAPGVDERIDRLVGMAMDEGEYDTHHHAVSATFDKVDPRMLALDTAVMTVAAYRLADAQEPVGFRLSAMEAMQLLKRAGLESMRRTVYEPGDSLSRR